MTAAGLLSTSRVIMPAGHAAALAGSGELNCTRAPNPRRKAGGGNFARAEPSPTPGLAAGFAVIGSFLLPGPRLQEVPAARGRVELGRLRLFRGAVTHLQLVAGHLVDAVALLPLQRAVLELE